MKCSFAISLILFSVSLVNAQKHVLSKSEVVFFSHAAIEDITASNKGAASLFNEETGEIVFSIPIQEFKFQKRLMQEHFNEKYMESDKYPKATFQGKLSGFKADSKSQDVHAIGKLTIHGVTRDVDITGNVQKTKDSYKMNAKFPVKLVDHKIEIPQLLWQNIAEQVEVTVTFEYKPQ